jgi:hypothetical protein
MGVALADAAIAAVLAAVGQFAELPGSG